MHQPIGTLGTKRLKSTKGRGAISNPDNRYDSLRIDDIDDGWWQDQSAPDTTTEVIDEIAKTIISRNKSPDLDFDQSINPYRGCEHGCIYCYARPSHAYWGFSPGLDFETKIVSKTNSPVLLKKAFDHPGYTCSVISIGANTDPYQPLESRIQLTRQILELMAVYRHPCSLITKSALIIRDLDLIGSMADRNLCSVAVSLTTLSDDLKRRLEPRTASPAARLRVIETLARRSIPVTLMVAPVIPMVNDHEIEKILAAGHNAGATSAHYIFLRLPHETAQLFREWLQEHYPNRVDHVLSLVRQSHGGKDYRADYFRRFTGEGVYADLIKQRFAIATKKLGLHTDQRLTLDTTQFIRPGSQLSLFAQ